MPVVLGLDLGTTTISSLALDLDTGTLLAACTRPNRAEITSPDDKSRGYSEWDARAIAVSACACLSEVATRVNWRDLSGIGITGQQHGVVLVDDSVTPRGPLINWQDRRAEQFLPGSGQTYVQRASELIGADAPRRTGCRLAAGYMAVSLFWMRENHVLPADARACFLTDYFAALLTSRTPVTDATCAASSGVLNLVTRDWDAELLASLGLPRSLFPEVRPSAEHLGGLTVELAKATGLPAGLPVFVGIGDNQASFLGSVSDPEDAVLVNVGTGGQVAAYTEAFTYDPELETRPFPGKGYLLVCAGLCGGRSYALLERFFHQVALEVLEMENPSASLFPAMNRLAERVPPGANGLRCEPFFTGTRARPELRASWTGVSAENFTPGHMTRALLEGMARAFHSGYETIERNLPRQRRRLVGAGNGIRENPLLARLVAEAFALPLATPVYREEAAVGAALAAAVYPDFQSAGRWIRYD